MKQICLLLATAFVLIFCLGSCEKEKYFEIASDTANDSLPPIPAPNPNPTNLGINTWQFTDSNNGSFHHGVIDTVETFFDARPIWNYLKIVGWPVNFNAVNDDTMLLTALFLPNPVIEPGTYDISSGIGGNHIFGYGNNTIVPPYGSNQNFCYYLATPDIAPGFVVKIISYDAQQRLLKGSFNGRLRRRATINDYSVTYHTIWGSFYLRLN